MEKQRVNDAVIKLGNLLIRARLYVVNRLSAKIKALRKNSNTKFESRIERMLAEIAYLKKLSNSRTRKLTARRALINEEDHDKLIEAESTQPDQRAFHRLCKTKFVENFIKDFRENNIDWKYWVPQLVDMWEKKIQVKEQTTGNNKQERPYIQEVDDTRKRKARDNNPSGDSMRKKIKTEAPDDEESEKRIAKMTQVDSEESEDDSSNDEERANTDDQEEQTGLANEESDSEPHFRPYAPSYYHGRKDVNSTDDSEETSDDSEKKSEVNRISMKPQPNQESESNSGQTDEGSYGGSQADAESSDSDDDQSESEESDEQDLQRKRQLLGLGSSKKPQRTEKSLEIDFSVQNKIAPLKRDLEDPAILAARKNTSIPDVKNEDSDATSSTSESSSDDEGNNFFIKEGETPKEVESRTIPKGQAPTMNRRERRGHDKMKYHNDESDNGSEEDDRAQSGPRFGQVAYRNNARTPKNSPDKQNRFGNQSSGGRFNQNRDQPRKSFGGNQMPGSFSGSRPRESFSGSQANQCRASFGGNRGRGSFGGGNRGRGSFGGNRSRESFGGDQRQSFNDNSDNLNKRFNGGQNFKPRFNDRSDRPEFRKNDRQGNDRAGQRKSFGGFNQAAPRESFQSRKSVTPFPNRQSQSNSEEQLHPSWQAKKKQSASINQPFQGKKIVFDD